MDLSPKYQVCATCETRNAMFRLECWHCGSINLTRPPEGTAPTHFDFRSHLARQAAFSEKTFGPGTRVHGVVDHIRRELKEIEQNPSDLVEWIDVVILALDGAWRSGASPLEIIAALVAKQSKNEARKWPDWRTMTPGKAIEHVRSGEAAPVTPLAPPTPYLDLTGAVGVQKEVNARMSAAVEKLAAPPTEVRETLEGILWDFFSDLHHLGDGGGDEEGAEPVVASAVEKILALSTPLPSAEVRGKVEELLNRYFSVCSDFGKLSWIGSDQAHMKKAAFDKSVAIKAEIISLLAPPPPDAVREAVELFDKFLTVGAYPDEDWSEEKVDGFKVAFDIVLKSLAYTELKVTLTSQPLPTDKAPAQERNEKCE